MHVPPAVMPNWGPEWLEMRRIKKQLHKEDRRRMREDMKRAVGKEADETMAELLNQTEIAEKQKQQERMYWAEDLPAEYHEALREEEEDARKAEELALARDGSSGFSTPTNETSINTESGFGTSDDTKSRFSSTSRSFSFSLPTSEYQPSA
jgi:hypothetical protein